MLLGKYCTNNINECLSNPCVNGVCLDLINQYSCFCVSGFNGTNCQFNINDCPANNCSGHGRCTDGINSYYCTCDGIILRLFK